MHKLGIKAQCVYPVRPGWVVGGVRVLGTPLWAPPPIVRCYRLKMCRLTG